MTDVRQFETPMERIERSIREIAEAPTMERMTNQQMADRALEADRQRRMAWARGDYQESREYLESRNDWIALMDEGYSNPKIAQMFSGRG